MVEDRKVGVAIDFSKNSKHALKWAIVNMADKGDTFYLIHINSSHDESRHKLFAKSGSREFFFFFFYNFFKSSVFFCFLY
jgi:hypothetical protein